MLLVVALITVLAGPLCAQSSSALGQGMSARPKVLVLVLSGMGPQDQVSINYTSKIPEQEVRNDLAALTRDSGWITSDVRITNKRVNRPGAPVTTSALFQSPGIVNFRDGLLKLEPFIVALKRFDVIQVNYLMTASLDFRGLGNFENQYVKMAMSRNGNSYVYTVRVKDRDFTRLNLPLMPEAKTAAPPRTSMPTGARVMLVIGIALVGAVVAYFLAAYISQRRKSRRRGDSNGT